MTAQDFERSVVHAFNDYASNFDKKLVAYRHLQMRYQPQLFDVLVDSRMNEFYYAIECKSIDPESVNGLYFKKHFTWQKGVCQVERENSWLNLSGRNGWLVVELRRARPGRHCLFFVPWRTVIRAYTDKRPGILSDQVTSCPCCTKQGGKYSFDDDFMKEVIEYNDSYPKNPRIAKRSWSKSGIH